MTTIPGSFGPTAIFPTERPSAPAQQRDGVTDRPTMSAAPLHCLPGKRDMDMAGICAQFAHHR